MKILSILTSACLLFVCSLNAQVKFIDRFSIRQSFQSKSYKAEPANISITRPKDTTSSWMLNIAIGYNVLHKSKKIMTLDPFIEFHKNTLIAKKQDNWQTGLAYEWQTINLDSSKKRWSPIILASAKYNDDRIKGNTSFQGSIYISFKSKQKGTEFKYFYLPGHPVDLGKVLRFEYAPYVGLENENRIKTTKDSAKGYIYRFFSRVTSLISLFPQNEKLREKFEFTVDYQYRNDFAKTVKTVHKPSHQYFTAGINYVFFQSNDKKKNARIGFDYVDGENPTQNFEKQSYYALSLKVKL